MILSADTVFIILIYDKMVNRTPIKNTPPKVNKEKRRKETARRQDIERKRELENRRRKTSIERALNSLSNGMTRILNMPKNAYNLGTILATNNRYMTVRLSKKLINNLKDVYKKTFTNQVEYSGTIPFTVKNTRNYVKYITPTARTNGQFATVTPPNSDFKEYIMYHTHPVPPNDKPLFSFPSGMDLKAYVRHYPDLQANIILENQGYYIIDLIETNMNKPNASRVATTFETLVTQREFSIVTGGYRVAVYVQTTPTRWKMAVNKYIDPIMRRQFGISIRYYTWDELGEITLLDKSVLMNAS